MTYAQALAEVAQRGIDALKVATNAQLASLEITRDIARTLSTPAPIAATCGSMTTATTAFAFALLEQQLAYAKNVSESLARTPALVSAPETAPLAVAAATIEPPVEVGPEPATATDTTVEPEAVAATTLDAVRDEQQRKIEMLSMTLPAPNGKLPAPRASGFAAKSTVARSVSNAKQPKRGPGKK
jgi:hypothetical protein